MDSRTDAPNEATAISSSPLSSMSEEALSALAKTGPIHDEKIDSSEPSTSPRSAEKNAMPCRSKKAKVTRKGKKRKWNAENLLTDSKSPLATADLRVRRPSHHFSRQFC